jgi:hypothetical protein
VIELSLELPCAAPPAPEKGELRELLTPLPQEGHYLLVIDNSAMEIFTRCPTAALYYLVHRRQAHARNAALTFGGALHEGLAELLRGKGEAEQERAILDYFLHNPAPPDEYRTAPLALQVMNYYRLRQAMPDYGWAILSDDYGPIIERPFELPLGVLDINARLKLPQWAQACLVKAIHVAWSGKIDALAELCGKNRVIDHKTTSVAGDTYTANFMISNQTLGYVWACQQLWPALEIEGFCLNAIYLRRPLPGATSLIARGPRNGAPALDFFRAFYDYSPERLAEWERNSLTLAEDFIHCLVRGFFPMFTNSCINKYGKCQFHDICTLDNPTVREVMLASDMYEDVTWSPTGQ